MSPESAQPLVVVLAAGTSSRLQEGGRTGPKQLARVSGVSLAERVLSAFRAVGLEEFAVILGSEADRVGDHYAKVATRLGVQIAFIRALDYQLGNGASALSARPLTRGRPFLLTMSDHLFAPGLIETMRVSPPAGREIALGVDAAIDRVFDIDDLTKVHAVDGWVKAIGKELDDWNGGDTGLFHATDELFKGLDKARADGRHSLSDGVRSCIAEGGVRAVTVTGHRWIDVDTPEALAEAERLVAAGELAAG